MHNITKQMEGPLPAASQLEGRHKYWHSQALLTTKMAIAAKLLSMGARLLTIPMALHMLGPERYGLWLSISSLLLWIGFVGPGLGYGLINSVSEANGKNDRQKMRADISTASITIVALGFSLLIMLPICSAWSGWARLLGVHDQSALAEDAKVLMLLAGAIFGLSLSLEFVPALCAALQEGYLTSLATAAATVVTLAGIAFLALFHGTLTSFALVVALPPVLANFCLLLYLFGRRHPELCPAWRLWNRSSFRSLMGFGGWMLLNQVAELSIFQSANLLIANRFGPSEVPRYAVPAAIFLSVTNVCYSMIQPYWPAVAEANARRDWAWIRSMMFQTLKVRTGIIAAAGLGMIVAGPFVIGVLAGGHATPGRALLTAMSVYYLLAVWAGNTSVLLLGLGLVRIKAMIAVPVAAMHVGGFFLLYPYLGLSAIPVAGGIGLFLDFAVSGAIGWRDIQSSQS